MNQCGAIIVGNWPTDGYTFESSKALLDDGNFIGLCIDEDRQPELTAERVEKWTKQIYDEMCLAELSLTISNLANLKGTLCLKKTSNYSKSRIKNY